MIRKIIITFLLVIFSLYARAYADDKGLEIIKQVYNSYRSTAYEREKIKAELITKGGSVHKTIVFEREIKYNPDSNDKMFIRIDDPPIDKGTALLIFCNTEPDSNDDMWLWMKDQRRVRRICQPQGEYLWGMDLTYQDVRMLVGEKWWDYSYMAEKEDSDFIILMVTPKPGVKSLYGSRKIWIQKASLFPARYEYFSASGKMIKTQEASGIHKDGKVWRWKKIEVKNLEDGHSTTLTCTKREVEEKIDDEVFTMKNLMRQQW